MNDRIVTQGAEALPRAAEILFNFPRLYRAKFAITSAILRVVRPLFFTTLVTVDDVILAARMVPGARICEIGCGDGENYRAIRKSVGEVDYTGVDINPAMIQHCKHEYPSQRWLCATPAYDFENDEFDLCVIVNVLHHLDSRQAVEDLLREAARISRTVLLFEPLQSENVLLYRVKQLYWALTDGGNRYYRVNEFRQLFDSLGLSRSYEKFSTPLRHFYGAHLAYNVEPER